MMREFTDSVASSVMAEKENFLRVLLDRVAPGWTLQSVPARCRWLRFEGSPIEVLEVDGVPVLEMYPIETETVRGKDSYTLKVSWKYRELGPALTVNPQS